MGQIKIQQQLVADTPPAGYINLYMDQSTGLPYYKNSSGVATALVAASTSAIGGIASLTANTAPSTTSETQIIGATLAAGAMAVGTTYRITALGQVTCQGGIIITFRMRLGATTLAGNIVTSLATTTANAVTAYGFSVEMLATVRTVGATGTIIAMLTLLNPGGTSGITNLGLVMAPANGTVPSTVVVNTTVANIIEFTAQTANTNSIPSFYVGAIEIVKA